MLKSLLIQGHLIFFVQMVKGGGKAPAVRGGGRGQKARNDAEEAMDDASADVIDTMAALNGAGESAVAAPTGPPEALLKRRLEKVQLEKATAIREKELLQKQVADMRAEMELAKANVGDVVPVTNPTTPASNKVNLKPYLIYKVCLKPL